MDALHHLNVRESVLGGYDVRFVDFKLKDSCECLTVLVFIATPDNPHYMGPAPLSTMAIEIAKARGQSGLNSEYVFKLADYMRRTFPDVVDEHLFLLESLVQDYLQYGCKQCQVEDRTFERQLCDYQEHGENVLVTGASR
ncbi:glutathione-specific gamma-glutamylcyclotransferase 1-like [Saccoglossus kowalevskii]